MNKPTTGNTHENVGLSFPRGVLQEIDRVATDRSRFVLDAVLRELARRRREGLLRSLVTPHPESIELAEAGFDDWARGLPLECAAGLVDVSAGTPVRWTEAGWETPE